MDLGQDHELDKSQQRFCPASLAGRNTKRATRRILGQSAAWGKAKRCRIFGCELGTGSGGMDGLIHVSELSWKHVDHPNSVVTVGDEVDVEVLEVDGERERISLSLKATTRSVARIVMVTKSASWFMNGDQVGQIRIFRSGWRSKDLSISRRCQRIT